MLVLKWDEAEMGLVLKMQVAASVLQVMRWVVPFVLNLEGHSAVRTLLHLLVEVA